MKYQVWVYQKRKWKVHDFGYEYNRALLVYCKKCIKHGSANVGFYRVVSSGRVKRIIIEPSEGEEVSITDEMRMR